jgi:hypothetical protein
MVARIVDKMAGSDPQTVRDSHNASDPNVSGNIHLQAYEADSKLFDGVDFCKRKIGLCELIGLSI